jgi:thymidylate kinase
MIFVNTSEEVAQERNQARKRTLPREEVKSMWMDVQKNIGAFQRFFGSKNFIILDNNGPNDDVLQMVFKRVRNMVKTPVKNYIAKQWIANELEKKRRR